MTHEEIQSELAAATRMMVAMYNYWLKYTESPREAYELAKAACSGDAIKYRRVKEAVGVMV